MASKQIKLAVTLTSHVDEKLNPIIKHLSDMARHTDRDMKLMSEGFAKLAGGIRGIALPALATFGVSAGGVVASIIGVSTQLSNLSRKSEDMRYASDWSRLSMSRINEMTNAVDVFGRSLPKLQTDIQQLGKLGFELSQGFTTSYVQGLKQSFHEHGLEREFSTLVGKQGDQLDDAIGAMIAKLTTRQREYVAQILGLTDEYVRRALDLQMAKKYNINLKFQIDEEAAEKFREQQLKFSSLFGEIETDIRNQLLGPFTQFTGEFNTWVELHKVDIANNVVKFFEGIVIAVKGVHTFFGWIDKGSKKTGRWLGKGLHGFKDMSKPPPGPATPPDNKGWWEHLKSGLHHPDSSTPYKFEEQEAPEEA